MFGNVIKAKLCIIPQRNYLIEWFVIKLEMMADSGRKNSICIG